MANDVFQLVIAGNCAGQFWEIVPHYESSVAMGPNPVGTATNLINGFNGGASVSLSDVLATDVNITGYKCKRVNNGGSPTVMLPITPVPGTVVGTSATSATAPCIILAYQHAMKFHTGRMFLPGIPETELAGNTFSPGYIAAINDFIAAAASISEGGNSFTLGVWSRKFTLFQTTQYQGLSAKPGIQRRRLKPVM